MRPICGLVLFYRSISRILYIVGPYRTVCIHFRELSISYHMFGFCEKEGIPQEANRRPRWQRVSLQCSNRSCVNTSASSHVFCPLICSVPVRYSLYCTYTMLVSLTSLWGLFTSHMAVEPFNAIGLIERVKNLLKAAAPLD